MLVYNIQLVIACEASHGFSYLGSCQSSENRTWVARTNATFELDRQIKIVSTRAFPEPEQLRFLTVELVLIFFACGYYFCFCFCFSVSLRQKSPPLMGITAEQ